MSYLEKEKELQSMVGQGQMMEAFDKFYAEHVIMEEPMTGKTEGKAANRKREEEWMASLEEMHGGGVTGMAVNEEAGMTMTELWMDATFKGGSRMKMEQVSVKKWEGDQIVHERFYYNTGQ
ncbi:MAG: SnoaL-like domain-containing protein [Bacteroidota bacterium]